MAAVATIYETRNDMLKGLLPKGGRIAEIGIFKGDFSEWIYKNIEPEQFVLVDPFFEGTIGSGDENGYNMEFYDGKMLYWYNRMRFAGMKGIQLERKTSAAYFADVSAGYFDVIYIDGDHSADGVRTDLEIARRVVKEGGWIFGSNYDRHPIRGNPEVSGSTKEVVDEFSKKYNLKIEAFAHDGFISYAIRNLHKAKVCVCSFSDRPELYNITYPRLEAYCKKHHYVFQPFHDHLIDTNVYHPSWNKIDILKKIVEAQIFDYVVWIDDDIYITDMEKPLMHFIDSHGFSSNGKTFLVCEDLDNRKVAFNCGLMVVKSVGPALQVLDTIKGMSTYQPLLQKNFSWEQEAFGFFYRFLSSDPFQIIPHRTLQSICRHFDCPIEEGWNRGDFAAHVTAGPIEDRLKLLHLLQKLI